MLILYDFDPDLKAQWPKKTSLLNSWQEWQTRAHIDEIVADRHELGDHLWSILTHVYVRF